MTIHRTSTHLPTAIGTPGVRIAGSATGSLAARLEAAIGARVPNVTNEVCSHVRCGCPATDEAFGFRWCRGHLFAVHQWMLVPA